MNRLTCFKVLMAMMIFAISGCKKDVAVTGVTVSPTTVSLTPGGTQQLAASVQPGNATNKAVTWSSGNTARAAVSPDGMVSIPAAATAGEVTITVTTADGGKTANCTVTVSVPVTSIIISGDATVEAGKTVTLTATVAPTNASNKNVTWSSLNTGVATVNAQTGVVTGVSEGTATIRATAADGSGVTADKSVTVTAAPPKTVTVGEQVGTLTAGTAGTVTFAVVTANVVNGTYAATVANLPAGVSVQGSVVINNNAGTLTLSGNSSTVAGATSTLTLTINGVTSAAFTLTISAVDKTVSVGAPSGTLMTGRAGTITYAVTTANIANGRTGAVAWYANEAGTAAAASAPTGITASVSNVASNASTVTVNAAATAVEGTYYFGVAIDGEQSNIATLTVLPNQSPWNIGHPAYSETVKATLTENTLTISGTGNMVDFWCSAEGKAPWWFDAVNRDAIRTVVIESGVTNIGNRAFKDCSNMETITISSSVTKINAQAFYGCSNLQEIKIPNTVASIEGDAFFNCSKLNKIEIENGSATLQFVGYRSANPCATSGTINKYDWFSGCTSLAELHLGRNYSGDFVSNIRTTLTTLTIGNTVNTIGTNAFADCRNLRIVRIEDGLNDLTFHLSGNSFINCPIQTLHLGRNVISSNNIYYWNALPFSGKTTLSSLTIGNNVIAIQSSFFNGCTSLTDVIIPDNVISLGSSVFSGCTELKNINIGRGIKTIESSTFFGCSKLTSITIPSTVDEIGANTFANCRSLITVTIQDDLKDLKLNLSGNSFDNCPIQTLHLGRNVISTNAVTWWNALPFSGKTTLSSLTIGNNVTAIQSSFFNGCTGLTDIIIPDNVTSLGSSAFSSCSELKSINIGRGIKTIESSTFFGCSKLTSITIPSTVDEIGANTFANCRSLITVTIQDGLNDLKLNQNGNSFTECPIQTLQLGRNVISNNAVTWWNALPFRGKTSLSSLIVGNNVTIIQASMFDGCTGLTQITSYPTTPPTIQSTTFTGVGTGIPVKVPSGSVSAYGGAQYWRLFTNIQGM